MSKKKKKEKGGAAPWIVTFSDLMSLLLTFFILLYSISTIDAIKFQKISKSLQLELAGTGRPSILDGGLEYTPMPFDDSPLSEVDVELDPEDPLEIATPEIVEMYNKVSDYITELDLEAEVTVMMVSSGVYVEIKDAILYEPGSAQLKPSGIDLLSRMEKMINSFENGIVVEGHTDNVPMNSAMYPSNWELSTARAVSVLRYLHEQMNVEPTRLSARGYGEFYPIAPNDSPENRARNRRVNLMILFEKEGGNNG